MNWVKNSQLQQCEKANPGFLEKSPTDSLDVCCLDQLFSSASNTNTNVSIQRMQNGISGSFFCLVIAMCLILEFNFWQTGGSLQVTLVKWRILGQTLWLGASVYFLKVNLKWVFIKYYFIKSHTMHLKEEATLNWPWRRIFILMPDPVKYFKKWKKKQVCKGAHFWSGVKWTQTSRECGIWTRSTEEGGDQCRHYKRF